jgi:hypothetical protein
MSPGMQRLVMDKSTDVSEERTCAMFMVEGKTRNQQVQGGWQSALFFFSGFLLGLLFEDEYGGSVFLRNVGGLHYLTPRI